MVEVIHGDQSFSVTECTSFFSLNHPLIYPLWPLSLSISFPWVHSSIHSFYSRVHRWPFDSSVDNVHLIHILIKMNELLRRRQSIITRLSLSHSYQMLSNNFSLTDTTKYANNDYSGIINELQSEFHSILTSILLIPARSFDVTIVSFLSLSTSLCAKTSTTMMSSLCGQHKCPIHGISSFYFQFLNWTSYFLMVIRVVWDELYSRRTFHHPFYQ